MKTTHSYFCYYGSCFKHNNKKIFTRTEKNILEKHFKFMFVKEPLTV